MTKRKISKVDDELLDAAGRALSNRLSNMLKVVPVNDPAWIGDRAPSASDRIECSFCGGAGEVETEVEDYAGSTVIITILCPH